MLSTSGETSIWCTSDVAAAVKAVKDIKGILIVLVHGQDEDSQQMIRGWESSKIRQALCNKNYVALKLESESNSARQFGAVYPVGSLPVTYFILHNGDVLFEVNGLIDTEALEKKIHACFKPPYYCNEKMTTETSQPVVVAERSSKKHTTENDVEAMRKKLKAQAAEEQKRLEQLRNQIASDRMEMRIRTRKQAASCAQQKTEIAGSKEELFGAHSNSNLARIQFRFPDGSKVEEMFDKKKKFETLLNFVAARMQSATSFKLVSMYPRREYSSDDADVSLDELGLSPSAVLLIVTLQSSAGVVPVGRFYYFMVNLVWSTISNVMSWLLSFMQPSTNATNRESRSDAPVRGTHGLNDNHSDDDDSNAYWNGNSTQQL